MTEEAGTLTLEGLWHSGSDMTQQQAGNTVDTFIGLLKAISQQQESPINALLKPLPRDLDQIWNWNGVLPPTTDRTMHEIISEQSVAHPDKVALSPWGGKWTYGEFKQLSTLLCYHLISRGITIGTNVCTFVL